MAKSRKPIVAGGEAIDGKVVFDFPKVVSAALKTWTGRIVVTIAPEEQRRSVRANAYLWGVIYRDAVAALKEAGYSSLTADQLHEILKDKHNAEVVIDPFTGEERRVVKSTRDLTVEEFGVFIEHSMVDLAELCGISFPEPRKHEDWREEN